MTRGLVIHAGKISLWLDWLVIYCVALKQQVLTSDKTSFLKGKKHFSRLCQMSCFGSRGSPDYLLSVNIMQILCRSAWHIKARLHVSSQGNDTAGKTIVTTTLLYLWVWRPFISLQPLMFRQSLAEVKRETEIKTLWRSIIQFYSFFQVERDSLVVCIGLCPWNPQLVLVGWVDCLVLFKRAII